MFAESKNNKSITNKIIVTEPFAMVKDSKTNCWYAIQTCNPRKALHTIPCIAEYKKFDSHENWIKI